MKVEQFDFHLPEECIAQQAMEPRDAAKLLVVKDSDYDDRAVRDITEYLNPGDVLVFNDTRVIPARLFGKRGDAGVEIFLHKPVREGVWEALAKPAKRIKEGDEIVFNPSFKATLIAKRDDGFVELAFAYSAAELLKRIHEHGVTPLPPYIKRDKQKHAEDEARYQTVYARQDGSVAAPTAGLHFTETLLEAIRNKGVHLAFVTLHVGAGTFLPVKVDDTQQHIMHKERAIVSAETAAVVNRARQMGGRVIAVGTTSMRTLESASDDAGTLHAYDSETGIFITPGYRFKICDMLMTNFHLPKSTLFMLVSAFSGLDRMKSAYAHAIQNHYRFYSFGDACLLYRSL
jgi:S-adenosylmethionine:tRNA ribosyltransferase-isomerase